MEEDVWVKTLQSRRDWLLLRYIVTSGNDGDVRIWEGLDDDDPRFITVGEKVHSLALKVAPHPHATSNIFLTDRPATKISLLLSAQNERLVTASSSNTVQIHTFPDGEPDGILTRFTTNATHVAFNSSGSKVAAGSRYCRNLSLFVIV